MDDVLDLDAVIVVAQSEAYNCAKLLRNNDIFCKLFPTPPSVFPGCSLALAVEFIEVAKSYANPKKRRHEGHQILISGREYN